MNHFGGPNQYYNPQDSSAMIHGPRGGNVPAGTGGVVYQPVYAATPSAAAPNAAAAPQAVQPVDGNPGHGAVQYQAGTYAMPVNTQWWPQGSVLQAAAPAVAWQPAGAAPATNSSVFVQTPAGSATAVVQQQQQQQPSQQQPQPQQSHALYAQVHPAAAGHGAVFAMASPPHYMLENRAPMSASSHSGSASLVSGPVYAEPVDSSPVRHGSARSLSSASQLRSRSRSPDDRRAPKRPRYELGDSRGSADGPGPGDHRLKSLPANGSTSASSRYETTKHSSVSSAFTPVTCPLSTNSCQTSVATISNAHTDDNKNLSFRDDDIGDCPPLMSSLSQGSVASTSSYTESSASSSAAVDSVAPNVNTGIATSSSQSRIQQQQQQQQQHQQQQQRRPPLYQQRQQQQRSNRYTHVSDNQNDCDGSAAASSSEEEDKDNNGGGTTSNDSSEEEESASEHSSSTSSHFDPRGGYGLPITTPTLVARKKQSPPPVPPLQSKHLAQRPRKARPSAARPSAARPSTAQPTPARSTASTAARSTASAAARSTASTAARPSQARPSPARPSQARPSQARPSPARPSPARPSPARPSLMRPSQARPPQPRPSMVRPSLARPARSAAAVSKVSSAAVLMHESSDDGVDEVDDSNDSDGSGSSDENGDGSEGSSSSDSDSDSDGSSSSDSSSSSESDGSSSSGSGSGSSSSDGDEDDDGQATGTCSGSNASSSDTSAVSSDAEPPPLKPTVVPIVSPANPAGRRRQVDETAVKVPLSYGWKRDTRLRPKFRGAMRGDVFYFSPCGKKLRTYPEVQRYLDANGISNLNISNFSFSTKLMVGEFHEKVQGERELVKLTPREVNERQLIADRRWKHPKAHSAATSVSAPVAAPAVAAVPRSSTARSGALSARHSSASAKGSIAAARGSTKRVPVKKYGRKGKAEPKGRGKKMTALRRKQLKVAEKIRLKEEVKRRKQEEKQMKRELKIQEKALRIQQAEEIKQQRRVEAERLRVEEARKRQQEREMKRDELRKEKEMKRLQILKEKEMKRQELILRRQQEAQFRAEEREKRRLELVMRRESEAKKRAEEREKLREQRLAAKLQKQEERRRQEELERSLRRPGEDLLVCGGAELPKLQRLETPVHSREFGMLLTVSQFLQDYSSVLELEFADGYIPDLADLMKYVTQKELVDDFLRLIEQLLTVLLGDEMASAQMVDDVLGVPLSTIKLSYGHLSEVLRLYIVHELNQPAGGRCAAAVKEAVTLLDRFPLSALCPSWKARLLEFLVNDICSSAFIAQHVEHQLEVAADLKRDKMKVECRLRKLRVLYKKIFARQRRPRRTADLSQFPATALEMYGHGSGSAAGTSHSGTGAGANGVNDSSANEEGAARRSHSGDIEAEDDKASKYEEDDEYDEEEDVSDEDDDGSSTEGEDQGNAEEDEDNEAIDIQLFEGELVVSTKESAEEQIAVCVKWQNRLRNRYNTAMRQVRTTPCGHDRYFRRYWIFPGQADVYVEGLDHDPLSSTIQTIANEPCAGTARFGFTDSASNTPVSHSARIEAKPTKRASFLELERQRLAETQKLWEADDARTEDMARLQEDPSSGVADGSGLPDGLHHVNHSAAPTAAAAATPNLPVPSFTQYNSQSSSWLGVSPAASTLATVASSSASACPVTAQPATPTMANANASEGSVAGGDSPVKSVATTVSVDDVPEHLQETLDVHSLSPDVIHGWFHLNSAPAMREFVDALHPRGQREQILRPSLHRHIDGLGEQPVESPEDSNAPFGRCTTATTPADEASVLVDQCRQGLDEMTASLLDIAQRVTDANLQSGGQEVEKEKIDALQSMKNEDELLKEAREQLLRLEGVIDRRYLKPPFREKKKAGMVSKAKDTSEDSDVTPALATWRSSVDNAGSASRIQLCAWQLCSSVAWEKSIMKVYCQQCRKGDNEDLLLLCDECENGYHTYCCVPKLSKVPEGDWFCRACLLMAERGHECEPCAGKGAGHVVCCGTCDKIHHLSCLAPPLTKMPRLPWTCSGCKKVKQRRQNEDDMTRQGKKKDLSSCRPMLAELEKHEDGWPFLAPVSRKQFPDYYKVIDAPMDFSAIRQKLKDGKFSSRDEFANSVRLVFDNCQTYNEDDSEVGCAGHAMRHFFEKRWKEVCSSTSSGLST
ncbi:bromodomain adjacent to zinc finger domain protein 2B-like isoform X2 [Sycon ciliatum]|uniref:bromodomain adjacent to zinc finger domain protein 2B-like isoform X2 n=1 Tax=Sycon ciliatum TaxID=27933 RepID=UPI0031F6CF8D